MEVSLFWGKGYTQGREVKKSCELDKEIWKEERLEKHTMLPKSNMTENT